MMKKIRLRVSPNDPLVAYVYLPNHPGKGTAGCVEKMVRLIELMPDYKDKGPDIIFDFNKDNELIGIEIVG